MVKLSDLPVELLQRIASFLTCSEAINLASVSHKLHNACYHRIVFKDIALYSLARDSNAPQAEILLWPEGHKVLESASISNTVRVAYATERALARANGRYGSSWVPQQTFSDAQDGVHSDIDAWLPQLLAWHHPTCKYLLNTSLLPAHLQLGRMLETSGPDKIHQHRASFINIGFCLAYFALQNLSKLSGNVNTPFELEDSIAKMSTEYMFSVCWGLKPPHIGQNCHFLSKFDLAQGCTSIVPFLYSILGGGFFGGIPFPVPSKIPFTSFMDVPGVFRNSSEAFTRCHIQKMTEPDFLTGTWMGYYTDQRLVNHRHFAVVGPPMNDINIVAEASGAANNGVDPKGYIHCTQTSGFDSHGPFTVCGEFYHDGRVEFVKAYSLFSCEWYYTGIVVPFGIVGRWSDLEGNFGGHYWIWKKDWCDTQ